MLWGVPDTMNKIKFKLQLIMKPCDHQFSVITIQVKGVSDDLSSVNTMPVSASGLGWITFAQKLKGRPFE